MKATNTTEVKVTLTLDEHEARQLFALARAAVAYPADVGERMAADDYKRLFDGRLGPYAAELSGALRKVLN